jgi:hypothetical protein
MASLESRSEGSFVEGGMTSGLEDEMAVFDNNKGTLKICNSSIKSTAFGSMTYCVSARESGTRALLEAIRE